MPFLRSASRPDNARVIHIQVTPASVIISVDVSPALLQGTIQRRSEVHSPSDRADFCRKNRRCGKVHF